MELLEEYNNLSQGDSLEEYNERFGELRLWLLSINPYLRESYFIWCYIKGLKLKIKSLVQLGRPKELEEAMKLVVLHNKSVTQELAQQPNPKPNSSISTLTETEIPNSTSTAFDVLGEGQTIQESSDRELEVLADGVLGDLEPELVVEEATELAQVEGITNLPNDMSQEIVDNFGEQEVSYLRQGPDENLAKQGTESKTSKVTSDLSFTVKSALDQRLESGVEEVAKGDENCIGNPLCSSQILKKMTDIGMISRGFLKIPVVYQVFGDLSDQGSALTKEIGNIFESFATAYNMFDKMSGEDRLTGNMNCNMYLVVFDPGGVGSSYGVSVLEAGSSVEFVFDPGIINGAVYGFKFIKDWVVLTPFDRGKSAATHVDTQWVVTSMGTFPYDRGRLSIVQVTDFSAQLLSGNFIFDPGGVLDWLLICLYATMCVVFLESKSYSSLEAGRVTIVFDSGGLLSIDGKYRQTMKESKKLLIFFFGGLEHGSCHKGQELKLLQCSCAEGRGPEPGIWHGHGAAVIQFLAVREFSCWLDVRAPSGML